MTGADTAQPAVRAKLAELARAQPGKLTYGSSGIGSSAFFAGELFKLMAKVDVLHVSYKGSSQVVAKNLELAKKIGLKPE